MSRTNRNRNSIEKAPRSNQSYRRLRRRALLREFERDYIHANADPHIEL